MAVCSRPAGFRRCFSRRSSGWPASCRPVTDRPGLPPSRRPRLSTPPCSTRGGPCSEPSFVFSQLGGLGGNCGFLGSFSVLSPPFVGRLNRVHHSRPRHGG